MAGYQRNYLSLKLLFNNKGQSFTIFIFSIIIVLHTLVFKEYVNCMPKTLAEYLAETTVNGRIIKHSLNVHREFINAGYGELGTHINNNSSPSLQFRIFKYTDLAGNHFPKGSPYAHCNLILDLPNQYNLHTALQLTKNSSLEGLNFKFFVDTNLFEIKQQQLISNHLRFYDLNQIKPVVPNENTVFQFEKFINVHYLKINNEFKKYFE